MEREGGGELGSNLSAEARGIITLLYIPRSVFAFSPSLELFSPGLRRRGVLLWDGKSGFLDGNGS